VRGAEGGWLSAPAQWCGGGRRKVLKAIGLVEALLYTTSTIALWECKVAPPINIYIPAIIIGE
jgi:hypothetical protein